MRTRLERDEYSNIRLLHVLPFLSHYCEVDIFEAIHVRNATLVFRELANLFKIKFNKIRITELRTIKFVLNLGLRIVIRKLEFYRNVFRIGNYLLYSSHRI